MVGPDEMIGGGLGCGVGAVRTVGRLFGEQTLLSEASVDLVGADVVEEPEATAGGSCRFEEIKRPDDIGLNEAVRPFD